MTIAARWRTEVKSREYTSWCSMKQRCLNQRNKRYRHYGGRGISICVRWLEKKTGYQNFLSDMGRRPSADRSIDRIDNNGNYEPSNCRWATRTEQARNQRGNRVLTYQGRAMLLTDAARLAGLSQSLVSHRINDRADCTDEEALALAGSLIVRGEEHSSAKLTEEDVRKIRKDYANGRVSYRTLAKLYGVGKTAIEQLITRTTWAHVTDLKDAGRGRLLP